MLTIRHLCKTYRNGVCALDDVSLDIPVGLFGLLGPNGAGKSSLMRTIASLQRPDEGSIHLDGMDLLLRDDPVRRTLGYLPQDFGVYPRVNAVRMLEHIAVLKGIPKTERRVVVEALLRRVNLWDVRDRMLGTYSGGMRQRFGIAQALLGSPRIVIVDEPTAGLDPEERARLLELLLEVANSACVIMSTHHVQDVAEACSSMAIIVGGRVVYSGSPADAIAALQGRVWGKLVGHADLDGYRERELVLSTRLVAGCSFIHVHADTAPDDGFVMAAPDLADAYFLYLSSTKSKVAQQVADVW